MWDRSGAFHAEPGAAGEPFSIVIPPPNVTAALHLGHALNNTLQDVLIRFNRMRGRNTLWMPGTDHAGIATQTVVEKRLLQKGKKRTDFTRAKFVELVQQWKDKYEETIIEQLKTIGCSCDWKRVRFTMDPVCERAVHEAFFQLFADGLIYRGKRLVNWDPVTLTALADDEVEMETVDGHMWYLRYPLVPSDGASDEATKPPAASAGQKAALRKGSDDRESEYVTVATTRPETMLGDTAVAVNPKDPRAAALVGRMVRVPIVNRLVPIIADEYVVLRGDPDNPMAEYATGFLKVTPAHDPNDWEIGRRHNLPIINVMAPDATISRDHGWPAEEFESGRAADARPLLGLSREEARTRIVQWFKDHDLLQEVRDYRHSVGHASRSHVPIEPYLSDQWYVKVTDDRLRGEALRALDRAQYDGAAPQRGDRSARDGDGGLRFFPARYAKTFQTWHENLRDWCISRQLWWGHQIPVWVGPPVPPLGAEDSKSDPTATDRGRRMHSEGRIAKQVFDQRHYLCVRDPGDHDAVSLLKEMGYRQDPDVLDTWFSSALWPISTMGWPEPKAFPETIGLLETFNPTSVLVTGRDIITLWVSRMVMFNRYFRQGTLPFRHVYINPLLQDGHGQTMSKSLGNGVDPRDIVCSHGADALRFALVQLATSTQDVRMPVDLLCPHCGRSFHPRQITSNEGHRVAAPEQECPGCHKPMASAYGATSGLTPPTKDKPLALNTSNRFDLGRNFANKLWNVTRFAVQKLQTPSDPATESHGPGGRKKEPDPGTLGLADRWILTRLYDTVQLVGEAMEHYQFNVYADAMYELIWGDFCDWYVEAIKPTVATNPTQQRVLRTVLEAILRLLHPICPFVTETLWGHIGADRATGELDGITLRRPAPGEPLAAAAWPVIAPQIQDQEAAALFARLQELTTGIRTLRSDHKVARHKRITLHAPSGIIALVESGGGVVETLAGLESVGPLGAGTPPAASVAMMFEGQELRLSGFHDAVDSKTQRARLDKVRQQLTGAIQGLRRKLADANYLTKAPPQVVAETRSQLAKKEADLAANERALQIIQKQCVQQTG